MDMKNEDIKLECEKQYAIIKNAQVKLDETRKVCKHEKTYKGTYSYRVGSYEYIDICEYCGEPVRRK